MKLIKGDILKDTDQNKITIILHGCNCFHTMGAGIAKYLRDRFPMVYKADCDTIYGDIHKLGTISYEDVGNDIWVVNCYTQFSFGKGRDVNYEAVYKTLHKVRTIIDNYEKETNFKIEVRSPQIGCGLAGGEWSIVEKMFEHLLPQAKIYYL